MYIFQLFECVFLDNGHLNVSKLSIRKENPVMEKLSISVAELIMKSKPKHGNSQDMLFLRSSIRFLFDLRCHNFLFQYFIRLPEILCFMTVNSMQSCIPRLNRIFNSVRFREILLDWMVEILGGVKVNEFSKNKHWLFANAIETSIIVVHENASHQLNLKPPTPKENSPEALQDPSANLSYALSKYSLEHSPIMDVYFNLNRTANTSHVCPTPFKVYLSHSPLRPFTTMRPETLVSEGKFREKKILHENVRSALKATSVVQNNLHSQFVANKRSMVSDVQKIRDSLKIQLSVLDKTKSVTQKDILSAAVAAAETNKYSALS